MVSDGISINFKPSVKQFKAWEHLTDNVTTYVGYGGAAFSGKSYLLCYWLTSMCIAYPGTGWGLGRKQLTNLKKSTLITLFKVFEECNIKNEGDYRYNQQNNTITFSNGSVIFLIDTASLPSDPLFTRFGGLELTGLALDESAETDFQAIEVLSTRIGRRLNGKYNLLAKILETFNPAKNHVYTRYYEPYKTGKEKSGTVFIPALPSDNPSPEVPAYIERIKANGNKVTIERLIYGNFEYDDDPSALLTYDQIIDLFNNSHVLPDNNKKAITADIALQGSDLMIIIFWNNFIAEVIKVIPKADGKQAVEAIELMANTYGVPKSRIVFDADGLGSYIGSYISNSKAFHNGGKALNDENYKNLKTQCIYKFCDRAREGGYWIKDDKHKLDIIQELEQLKRCNIDNDTGKLEVVSKDIIKSIIGHSPDFSDSLIMREFLELKRTGFFV
jgi:phage terminase large subunit